MKKLLFPIILLTPFSLFAGPEQPAVFKAISQTYQKVHHREKVRDSMKGHLGVVKEAKALAKSTCLKKGNKFKLVQAELSKMAEAKVAKNQQMKSVKINLKFLDSNCNGKMSVQTNGTIQETSF